MISVFSFVLLVLSFTFVFLKHALIQSKPCCYMYTLSSRHRGPVWISEPLLWPPPTVWYVGRPLVAASFRELSWQPSREPQRAAAELGGFTGPRLLEQRASWMISPLPRSHYSSLTFSTSDKQWGPAGLACPPPHPPLLSTLPPPLLQPGKLL